MTWLKDHRSRWITGVVGLIMVTTLVGYASKPFFFLFIVLINCLVLNEFYGLGSCSLRSKTVGIAFGLLLTAGCHILRDAPLAALMTGIGLFICIASLINFERAEFLDTALEQQLIGTFVIAFLLCHVMWLRELEGGKLWLFFLLSVVFAGDSCAFYGGTFFGQHKLAPRISPRKTVEGAVAGLGGSCLGGVMCSFFFPHKHSPLVIVVLALILGALSQLGDLWESMLKRRAQVKDSGWLLPGHGGIFDRVDSLLFPAPVLYYVILLKVGWG